MGMGLAPDTSNSPLPTPAAVRPGRTIRASYLVPANRKHGKPAPALEKSGCHLILVSIFFIQLPRQSNRIQEETRKLG